MTQSAQPQGAPHDAQQQGTGTRPGLVERARSWWRWLVHKWRASLQFRIVTTTVLLSLIVILLVGGYLFRAIAGGLEADRVRQAQGEARTLTRIAQDSFDTSDRTGSVEELTGLVNSVVRQQLVPQGTDPDRQIILTRSINNDSPTLLSTVLSGDIQPADIPLDLRRAVAADPTRQQTKVSQVSVDGNRLPAVIVGSQVEISLAGSYDLYVVYPMQREQDTLDLIARSLALGSLGLLALVGGVSYLVTRQVVTPVRRAAVVAERLSSGRLNERMRARGEDDLAMLGKSFNEMADSLQNQIRQLEGLSRLQQRFTSDVSHELRTPLTTIRMAADLIYDSRDGFDPVVGRSAELLHNELDRFEELLADLLEISRFDAGAAALDAESTDLRDSVARVVDFAEPLARRRGSEVTITATGECIAEIDSRRVERILRNLVVNAIEHGEGQPIEVRVAGNATAVAVAVRDHGVGLKPGEASLVFNRFWRADPARARTTGGTGLGLAISLEDARLHDGWLQAWGEPGAGSVFRLTLPRRRGVAIGESPVPLQPSDGEAPYDQESDR
ncbi:MAG: HAMP domain-containing histidine kinase [Micrococcales bacterium]|nr:HAMP domain-containing histidine kinase [Micrococcales bacterium]